MMLDLRSDIEGFRGFESHPSHLFFVVISISGSIFRTQVAQKSVHSCRNGVH